VPKAAPAPLRLVQLLVNTRDHEHGREWLPDPQALADWVAEHQLASGVQASDADLRRALELREALRSLLRANNGRPAEPDAAATFNAVAQAAGLTLELSAEGVVAIAPQGGGLDGALGRIVAVAFGAMLDGSWTRLKACRRCGWGFYDYSKNRSAGWCSMALCGNRVKTRAYRSRHAQRGRPA